MAEDDSLKDEMGEQIRAQRERAEQAPTARRTVFIEPGTHPAHAEVDPVPEDARPGLIARLLRRR